MLRLELIIIIMPCAMLLARNRPWERLHFNIWRMMVHLLVDALIAVNAWRNVFLAPWWRHILLYHVDIINADGAMRAMMTFILDLLTASLIAIIVEEDVPSHVAMCFTTLGIGLIVTMWA